MKHIGRIDIIMGCMFSGKSTEIIRLINRYKALDKKILIINHNNDIRYKKDSISTHSNINIDCISIDNLDSIKEESKYEYSSKDVIVIEEAQFFSKLYEFVLDSAEKDNKIIILDETD